MNKSKYTIVCIFSLLNIGLLLFPAFVYCRISKTNKSFDDIKFMNTDVLSPVFSMQSGFYDSDFELELNSEPGTRIYYTTDNTNPTEKSTLYNSPIKITDVSSNENIASAERNISPFDDTYIPDYQVDKCNVIKTIAIDEYGNKSSVSAGVYFIGFDKKEGYDKINIMSLSLEPEDLFGYVQGIYTTGRTFRRSSMEITSVANYTQRGTEWEREAKLFYFDNDRNYVFQQDIGITIHGGWSRAFNQKSFNLYARPEYSGTNYFESSILDEENLNTFMLRSGGVRDTFITKIRDVLNQELIKNRDISCMDSVPCVLFLNGEYWGLYNLQERFNENYISNHFGVDVDNVIIVRMGKIDVGTDEDFILYKNLVDFFEENDFSISSNYKKACDYIDIQSFIEYVSAEVYVGNIDWPKNNIRMWRTRDTSDNPYEDGKWRFMFYDTDDCANILGCSEMCAANIDSFLPKAHWDSSPLSDDSFVGLVFTKLLQNDEFCKQFKSTFLDMAENDFDYYRVHELLYDMADQYAEPMVNFYDRFVSTEPEYDKSYFYDQVDVIDDFFKQRKAYICEYMNYHVQTRGVLPEEVEISEPKDYSLSFWLSYIKQNFNLLITFMSVFIMLVFFMIMIIAVIKDNKTTVSNKST